VTLGDATNSYGPTRARTCEREQVVPSQCVTVGISEGRNVVSNVRDSGLHTFSTGGDGDGAALDSFKAPAWCPTARPCSSASTGFLRLLAFLLSSHGIPMMALALLSERIIESQQAGCCRRRAVTKTAGRVGHKPAAVGRASDVGVGGGSSVRKANRRAGRVKRVSAADARNCCERRLRQKSRTKIGFYWQKL